MDSRWEQARTEVPEGRASLSRSSPTERPCPRADRGSSLPTLTSRSSFGSWALERPSRDAGGPRLSGPGIGRHCFATWAVAHAGYTTEQIADALGHRRPGAASHYIHAAAVEPLRRPMAKAIEALLLAELGMIEGAPVLPFARGGVGPKPG